MQKTDRGAVDLHDARGVADCAQGLLRDPNSRLVRVAQVEPVEDDAALVGEAADLLFHLLILLNQRGIPLADVLAELERREGRSGIEEKAGRLT